MKRYWDNPKLGPNEREIGFLAYWRAFEKWMDHPVPCGEAWRARHAVAAMQARHAAIK